MATAVCLHNLFWQAQVMPCRASIIDAQSVLYNQRTRNGMKEHEIYITRHPLCLHCSKYPSSSSLRNGIPCFLRTPVTLMFCSPDPCIQRSRCTIPPSSVSSTLIVHLPLLTCTSVSSRGKWNSGKNISVGSSSVAFVLLSRMRVKTALRRSNP